jgi:GGDEF domain-containing protein
VRSRHAFWGLGSSPPTSSSSNRYRTRLKRSVPTLKNFVPSSSPTTPSSFARYARQTDRAPYILYVAEIDEALEREVGPIDGADDCIGRRSPERELHARIGAARRIAELESVLRLALVENRKLSTTDDLTRVANRRFFTKHFPREVERAARYGSALLLILCDIDHFKNVNDTLGHAGGDSKPEHRSNSELRALWSRVSSARRTQVRGEPRQSRGRSVIQK